MTETARPSARPPIAWITWLRLGAVLGVISIHNAAFNASAAAKGDLRKSNVLGVLLDMPFGIAVPLFVMVSGALTLDPASFRGASHFLRKRALRLVPPIIVWNLFYLLLAQLWFDPRTWPEAWQRVLTAKHVPHLYFLWIVFGLSMLSPIFIRWLKGASRREQLWTAIGIAAIPMLTVATRNIRLNKGLLLETPWTWWFGYLGLYLLGFILRDVVLKGWRLALAAALWAGLTVLLCVQFTFPKSVPLVTQFSPNSYYSLTTVTATVCCYLTVRSTVREGGLLAVLARPGVVKWVNPISLASLGIYAIHIAVIWVFVTYRVFGPHLTSGVNLVLRLVAVTVVSIVVTLVARKIPYLRRLF